MSKNNEIKFVSQPIFKQIIDLLIVVDISLLIKQHNSNLYYKTLGKITYNNQAVQGLLVAVIQ